MQVTLYGYGRCSTCREAKRWLEERGFRVEWRDMVASPLRAEELRSLIQKSGLQMKRFFNTSGQKYRDLGLKERLPGWDEEEALSALASDGMLVKRPILTDGVHVLVGFKPVEWEKVLPPATQG